MQLPYRFYKWIFNTYTGKSKTNFLLVGFVLQSSFKSELQISVARRCRGGDEEDLKQERNVLDVAVCLVKNHICSWPQVTARDHVSSGHSSPLCIIPPFPFLSFLPRLFILSSCGTAKSHSGTSCILVHHFTLLDEKKKKNLTHPSAEVRIIRKYFSFFYQAFPKCFINWLIVDLLSLFNSAVLNMICALASPLSKTSASSSCRRVRHSGGRPRLSSGRPGIWCQQGLPVSDVAATQCRWRLTCGWLLCGKVRIHRCFTPLKYALAIYKSG